MISVKIIEKVYMMNKQNKKLSLILKTWLGNKYIKTGDKMIRIPYSKLKENMKERIIIFLLDNLKIIVCVLLILCLLLSIRRLVNICI